MSDDDENDNSPPVTDPEKHFEDSDSGREEVVERYMQQTTRGGSDDSNSGKFPKSILVVAAVVLVIGIILAGFAVASVGNLGSDEEWLSVDSKIDAKYPGYYWIEIEDCYEDVWGDEYCEYWYELECWVDLDVSYIVENTTYYSQFDQYHINFYDDYDGVEDDCLEYGQNGTMMVGTSLEIFYNSNDPSDAHLYPPGEISFGFILVMVGIIGFAVVFAVMSRKNNLGGGGSSPGFNLHIGGLGYQIGSGRGRQRKSRRSRSGSGGRSRRGGRSGGGGR